MVIFGCFDSCSGVSMVPVVSVVSFRWFRSGVSGFSTCPDQGIGLYLQISDRTSVFACEPACSIVNFEPACSRVFKPVLTFVD